MLTLFTYNWQVRNEWIDWCRPLANEELNRQRTGGMGTILRTLAHIIDVECSWIRAIQGKVDVEINLDAYVTIEKVEELSKRYHHEVIGYLNSPSFDDGHEMIEPAWMGGRLYDKNRILNHLIAHEIHHIGQLSIWSRELGIEPVAASLIERDLQVH
ncbi:DinB family protein [Bacillus sp. mrc49]|uniref:DinB family protein n=1 Tax=Bacillus sp. mrc49 TaxID=2054913 RepID=UPI000C27B1BF|nr:DinB family protein [Bacillus sp. mrc49]PJN87483.1 damage-inducible protein DinB [Bacillus sp. mrc49]